MMLEGAGFEVIDIGINNPVEKYLEALEKHKPDILGMSALLTTTMPYMKVVIDELKDRRIRDDYIVLVGGAPLNEEFGKAVGADAYCRDAAIAVETAKSMIAARRAMAREPLGPTHHGATSKALAWSSPAVRWRARSPRCARPMAGAAWTCSCLPRAIAQSTRTYPGGRARRRSAMHAPATADLRRLCRLRHRRSPRRGLGRRRHRALPGAHCYEFYAGSAVFAALAQAEPGTFYLTDFLARHFERLVIQGLGIDRHPELVRIYFGNYRQLVFLRKPPTPRRVRPCARWRCKRRRAWDWPSSSARPATARWRTSLAARCGATEQPTGAVACPS